MRKLIVSNFVTFHEGNILLMINVCFQCGMYHADKIIDPLGPFAICPECGYKHLFRQLPLLIVSGASGTGKTTICQRLLGQVTQAVLLDTDILWRPEFNTPDTNYRDFLRSGCVFARTFLSPVSLLCYSEQEQVCPKTLNFVSSEGIFRKYITWPWSVLMKH